VLCDEAVPAKIGHALGLATRRKVTMTADVCEILEKRAVGAKGPFVISSKDDPNRYS
jgi:hypothetical protein